VACFEPGSRTAASSGLGLRTEECSRKEGGSSPVQEDLGAETATDGCLEKLLSVGRELAGPEILGHRHPIRDAHL
jgi:hypothetical protein